MQEIMRRVFAGRLIPSVLGGLLGGRLASPEPALAQSPGRVSRFDHIALPMRRTELMISFYRALGLRVVEGRRICSVHFGDSKINFHRQSLWQDSQFTLRAPAAEPPCGDFCLVWDGGEESLLQALTRANASVMEGPVERAGGRDGGDATGISRYTRDPDGNLIEFILY